jgi:hypothetical protein
MGSRVLDNSQFISEGTTTSYALDRCLTERAVDLTHVAQGMIFFLPAETDLPRKAVRRAHGKGRIEDKIHDHPVVVISRPAQESNIVHFHLVRGA